MKIVVLDGFHLNPGDLSWDILNDFGEVTIFNQSLPAELFLRSKEADIVLINKVVFDKDLLDRLPLLKCICVTATGYNNVDVAYANKKGILVCNVAGYSTESVAQHVFASLFNILNRIKEYNTQVRSGEWTKRDDWSYTLEPITNVKDKTLGLLGFGKIGQKVARIAIQFGMKVIAFHKYPERDIMEHVRFVDLETLFKKSDVLSLHVPLNNSTHEIINEYHIGLMKEDSILINTGRGGLIKENDLAVALRDGNIRAAALDVLVNEPPHADNPLVPLENCFITPHIAWAGIEARKILLKSLYENIKSFIEGNPINVIKG